MFKLTQNFLFGASYVKLSSSVDVSLGISFRSNRLFKSYFRLLTAASTASVYSISFSSIKLSNVLITFLCILGYVNISVVAFCGKQEAEGYKLENNLE